MNQERHTPLDPSERALADALARLPAIEPSPELDARILTHAADANAHSRRASHRPQRQRWWLGTGLGTAAAAVLAAGVAWQVGLFDIGIHSNLPVPRSQRPLVEPPSQNDAISIDLEHQPVRKATTAANEASAEAVGAAAPAIPPVAPAQERSQRAAPPPAPLASPPPPMEPRPAATSAIPSDAITTRAGVRARSERLPALPDWHQDADLPPEAWLERIRERLQRDENAAASASLHAFRTRYPNLTVPDDLAGLLAE